MNYNQENFDRAKNNNIPEEYQSDCERIRNVAFSMGISMSLNEAMTVWDNWSENVAAEWLSIIDDNEIKSAIRSFIISSEELE